MGTTHIKLTRLRDRLAASLWFAPAIASVLAFLAVQALVAIDRNIGQQQRAWFLFGGQSESARELLSTIASSMITFTGLVFSITILVLQLASGQFSPRVLRTFLEDRITQLSMAAFVGTFVFAMALLPEVLGESDNRASFVPALSVFVAFTLVLMSVGVFISYINHMAHAVRAVSIIKRVAAETRRAMARMYPEEFLDSPEPPAAAPGQDPDFVIRHEGEPGVLTAVDEGALLTLACGCDALVALIPMPGDFVPCGAPLFKIWGRRPVEEAVFRSAVSIEAERTPHQDPAFGFRQLVDIAERALSPGTNDPSTAVQVLDEIHDLLRALGSRRFPSPYRVDQDGRLRLILPRLDWEGYVHLAFDEIRQYGENSIQVVRRIRAALNDCLLVVAPERKAILEQQLQLLDAAVQRGFHSPGERLVAQDPTIQGHGPT